MALGGFLELEELDGDATILSGNIELPENDQEFDNMDLDLSDDEDGEKKKQKKVTCPD